MPYSFLKSFLKYVSLIKDLAAASDNEKSLLKQFCSIYKTDLFNEPMPKLTQIPLLVGVDGQKMGKSFNNDIKISDDETTTAKKLMQCVTDRSRARKDDPRSRRTNPSSRQELMSNESKS